jgi:glycogen synthase
MRLPQEPDLPLIGFIGRLDYQKGPDLLLDALPILANLDCQVRDVHMQLHAEHVCIGAWLGLVVT